MMCLQTFSFIKCPFLNSKVLQNIEAYKYKLHVGVLVFIKQSFVFYRYLRPFAGSDTPECKVGGTFYSSKKTFLDALSKADRTQYLTVKVCVK